MNQTNNNNNKQIKDRFPATDVQPGEHDDDLHVEHIEFKGEKIINVLKEFLEDYAIVSEIHLHSNLRTELDSIDMIEFEFQIEQYYDIRISTEMEKVNTLSDIILLIKSKL